MGLFTALSQLSGTLAPLIASWIYKDYGTYLTFTCSMLLSFLSVVLNVAYFKRFKYRTNEWKLTLTVIVVFIYLLIAYWHDPEEKTNKQYDSFLSF